MSRRRRARSHSPEVAANRELQRQRDLERAERARRRKERRRAELYRRRLREADE